MKSLEPTNTFAVARWGGPLAEAFVSVAVALGFAITCGNIKVDPMDRIGQVSGLASMQFRFTLIGATLLVILVVAARLRGGRAFDLASRIACAAVAGLVTGVVAGGVVVALRGTSYGLNGAHGDTGNIALSANLIRTGRLLPSIYPPGSLYGLAWYADLFDLPSLYAIKHLQIAGTALLGPAVYMSWRSMLRPIWALGIGVTAALPLIDSGAYKPYSVIVLLVFLPLVVRFLQVLRHVDQQPYLYIAQRGVLFGVAFGALCLLYAGWFKWSAPGLLVAGAVVFPWRRDWRKGMVLSLIMLAVFVLLAGSYISGILGDTGKIDDKFFYFDTLSDPTYIAMFGGSLPATQVWPPLGELGGVGLFSVFLAAGTAAAVALGRGRTITIALGSTAIGAWLMRYWYAHLMYKTKLVQLYPRTTSELLYSLLILSGFAVYWAVSRHGERRATPPTVVAGRDALIGALCGLMIVFASAASLIANRYMPSENTPMSYGILAWHSHHTIPLGEPGSERLPGALLNPPEPVPNTP